MTAEVADVTEKKDTSKEYNFRAQAAAYEQRLQEERQKREQLEKEKQEIIERYSQKDDDEDNGYIDTKTLNQFGQNTKSEIQKAMDLAKAQAKEELKKEMWMEKHPDFQSTLEKYSEQFYENHKDLANGILNIQNDFERQKLAYQTIKSLKMGEEKPQTMQDKIDNTKRGVYYQPTGIGGPPYAASSDFSKEGQKQAYNKLLELKKRWRSG